MDEQYLACLVEYTVCGSAEPNDVSRPKIKRILADYPELTARLRVNRQEDEVGNITWEADVERVGNVVRKLARGHMAYELGLPKFEEPDQIAFVPLVTMSNEQRSEFESPSCQMGAAMFPEIGSRAFLRAVGEPSTSSMGDWRVVQPERYRYMVAQSDGDFVQMVLSEYLACRVAWH